MVGLRALAFVSRLVCRREKVQLNLGVDAVTLVTNLSLQVEVVFL